MGDTTMVRKLIIEITKNILLLACNKPLDKLFAWGDERYCLPENFRLPNDYTGQSARFFFLITIGLVEETSPCIVLAENMLRLDEQIFATIDIAKDAPQKRLANLQHIEQAVQKKGGDTLLAGLFLSHTHQNLIHGKNFYGTIMEHIIQEGLKLNINERASLQQ